MAFVHTASKRTRWKQKRAMRLKEQRMNHLKLSLIKLYNDLSNKSVTLSVCTTVYPKISGLSQYRNKQQ
jgi:hypothetical protein